MIDSLNTQYFKFKLEGESEVYTIPQTVTDGSDIINFSSAWTKQNLSGSTEPMVAFNYVDAPVTNINLIFHEDMWRDAGLPTSGYLNVINKFTSMIYPGQSGQIIKPPYCYLYIGNYIYRGYFTSIRINQYGMIRNGYKTSCQINSSFTIIKKTAPTQLGVGTGKGFRTYFTN